MSFNIIIEKRLALNARRHFHILVLPLLFLSLFLLFCFCFFSHDLCHHLRFHSFRCTCSGASKCTLLLSKVGGTYGGKKEKKNGRTSWWLLCVGCHHIFGNVRIFFSFEMNRASNFGLWDTCTVGGGFFSERKKETGAGLGLGFIRNSVQKNFPSARQNVPVGIA